MKKLTEEEMAELQGNGYCQDLYNLLTGGGYQGDIYWGWEVYRTECMDEPYGG